MGRAMSERNLTLAEQAKQLFDGSLSEDVRTLDSIPDLSDADVLSVTRKIRLRQLALDLDKNGGELSDDPEIRKVQLALLKDLDNQATKIMAIGAKEKASAADLEASLAVQRMLQLMGDRPMRREPGDSNDSNPRIRPSIADAAGLTPLVIKPDETQVGIDSTTYEELMERVIKE